MDMRKNKRSSFKSSLLQFICLSTLLLSCVTDQDRSSYPSNLSFDFSGSTNGTFELFKAKPEGGSNLYIYGGGLNDNHMDITAIHWIKQDTLADIVTINLKSQTDLVKGQFFRSDSSSSNIDAVIGFSVPIKTTHDLNRGDVYTILDSSGFNNITSSFTLDNFDPTTGAYSMSGTFSGVFSKSNHETIVVQNGAAYVHLF
jgi:hypothetical protein